MKTTTKRQTKKIGVAGSFQNQLMGNNSSLPRVGKGATQLHYSDRSPFQVIEVSADGKTAKLEFYDHEADASKGPIQMGHQNWNLVPTGRFLTIVWRQGAWRVVTYKECCDDLKVNGKPRIKADYKKISIIFGVMEYYYDWTF